MFIIEKCNDKKLLRLKLSSDQSLSKKKLVKERLFLFFPKSSIGTVKVIK